MAVARQARAGKDYECGRCHKTIKKGDTYRWAKPGFRARHKKIRCMDCPFRASELTTSKMSGAYAAIEDAEDTITDATTLADITEAMTTCGDGLRDVASEYEEASNNWAGGNGREEWTEAAEQLNEAGDECDEWQPEGDVSHDNDDDPEAEDIDDPDPDELQGWKDDALSVLSGLSLP